MSEALTVAPMTFAGLWASLFIQKADASMIGDLADGVMKLFGETEKKIIGTVPLPSFVKYDILG